MKIMRILGVAVLAATVAGCTLSERQFVEYRAVFNKHPELRAKYHAMCVKEIRRSPRSKIELAAAFGISQRPFDLCRLQGFVPQKAHAAPDPHSTREVETFSHQSQLVSLIVDIRKTL